MSHLQLAHALGGVWLLQTHSPVRAMRPFCARSLVRSRAFQSLLHEASPAWFAADKRHNGCYFLKRKGEPALSL